MSWCRAVPYRICDKMMSTAVTWYLGTSSLKNLFLQICKSRNQEEIRFENKIEDCGNNAVIHQQNMGLEGKGNSFNLEYFWVAACLPLSGDIHSDFRTMPKKPICSAFRPNVMSVYTVNIAIQTNNKPRPALKFVLTLLSHKRSLANEQYSTSGWCRNRLAEQFSGLHHSNVTNGNIILVSWLSTQ